MTALEKWTMLVQAKLAEGYSTMNADEAINKAYPGLWQAAVAEHARNVRRGTPPVAPRWSRR